MSARTLLLLSVIAIGIPALAAAGLSRNVASEESPGNPPRILLAAEINAAGELVLASYRTIYIGFGGDCYNHRTLKSVSLKEAKLRTVGGKELSLDEARERLDGETAILATAWKHDVPAAYRSLLQDDALVVVFPKDAPEWEDMQDPTASLGK